VGKTWAAGLSKDSHPKGRTGKEWGGGWVGVRKILDKGKLLNEGGKTCGSFRWGPLLEKNTREVRKKKSKKGLRCQKGHCERQGKKTDWRCRGGLGRGTRRGNKLMRRQERNWTPLGAQIKRG